jgi:hypothetical protein
MLGRKAQQGWLGIKHEGRSKPSTASNHPDSSCRLLSAPPCPRRGTALFSSLGVPPRGMRGSPEMGSPPQLRRGRKAQRGWLEIKHQGCGSKPSTASNHPDSSCRLLSAPPCPKRGTAHFHPWGCRPAACAAFLKALLVVVLVLVIEGKPNTTTRTKEKKWRKCFVDSRVLRNT